MMTPESFTNFRTRKGVYNFKFFRAPEKEGFDYNPSLTREFGKLGPKSVELGEAGLIQRLSEHDPWSDVEIFRVFAAIHAIGDNTMLPGSVAAEVDQAEFAPYAFMKLDAS